ncbi:hypothetical protein PGQ11_003032 [Apiospora arundinis]|uniref:Chromatin target of PRMT1 protein C-terminal domain-containing protein n=1 Tax=Apiospora arundinis TaxID=335852 RepID=A0ABR2J3Z0_9PEZI
MAATGGTAAGNSANHGDPPKSEHEMKRDEGDAGKQKKDYVEGMNTGTKRAREEDSNDNDSQKPPAQKPRLEESEFRVVKTNHEEIVIITISPNGTMIADVTGREGALNAVVIYCMEERPDLLASYDPNRPRDTHNGIQGSDTTSRPVFGNVWLKRLDSAFDNINRIFDHLEREGCDLPLPDDTPVRLEMSDPERTGERLDSNTYLDDSPTAEYRRSGATSTTSPNRRRGIRSVHRRNTGRQGGKPTKEEELQKLDQEMDEYWEHGPMKN